ncbi:MAG: hypothetical protein RL154_743 [Pseudomonadota bacterium]
MQGYWIPVLHSHLPFVKHPEYDYFLEEHWLFEAISETYIPLLRRFKELHDSGVNFKITVSVTPPLAEMLSDGNLMDKYIKHLDKIVGLCDKEIERNKDSEEYLKLASFYREFFLSTKEFFTGFLRYNVLNGYKYFQDLGLIEVITCGATHGFLPLLAVNPKAVDVQIKLAVQTHEKHFGRKPNGIWLPECAYFDGLDAVLAKYDIKFFIMDSHGLLYGKPTPKYGVFAPIYTPNGVAAFARDPESSKKVWSSKEGYPGDFCYRDFYRDIGYDLDFEYIKDYICPDGSRVFTGLKYHKVTSESEHKEAYDPYIAKQIEHIASFMDRPPCITSPYDAELYGHWWFEGPDFLAEMFKEIDKYKAFQAVTPMEYLRLQNSNQVISPNPSSWGDKGYYDVWINSGNDWIYRHLHFMADVMCEQSVAHQYDADHTQTRVLNQMAKELLLAQSSDWAFLMTTQTAVEYSVKRTKSHIAAFNKLLNMLESNDYNFELLEELERRDSIFYGLDFRIFV